MYRVGYHIFTAHKEDRFFEDHHVSRCPIFRPKSSEEQIKVITPAECADVQFFAQNQMKSKKRVSRPRMPSFPTKI